MRPTISTTHSANAFLVEWHNVAPRCAPHVPSRTLTAAKLRSFSTSTRSAWARFRHSAEPITVTVVNLHTSEPEPTLSLQIESLPSPPTHPPIIIEMHNTKHAKHATWKSTRGSCLKAYSPIDVSGRVQIRGHEPVRRF